MFKKLFSSQDKSQFPPAPVYKPYRQPDINRIYHLLFCDDLEAYRPAKGQEAAPWQKVLFAEPGQPQAIEALAGDPRYEGRIRALAYHWLRSHRQAVPSQVFMGIIIEVALKDGLDVLAAFVNGGLRYINYTGHTSFFEAIPPHMKTVVDQLLAAAHSTVRQIGPWEKQRLPPPDFGNVRFSFLVSDGLYFGQGGMDVMQNDPMAGPLLVHGARLIQLIADIRK